MSPEHYNEILSKQLLMNRQTWAALQGHGITADSQLRLEFSYNAPSHAAAEALVLLIKQQTDYEIESRLAVILSIVSGVLKALLRRPLFHSKYWTNG
jgi:hypothetical protein